MSILSRILSALARLIGGVLALFSPPVWFVIAVVGILVLILLTFLYSVFSSPNGWTNLMGMGVYGDTQLSPGATGNYRVMVTTRAPSMGETFAVDIYEEDPEWFDGDDLLHRVTITMALGETQATVPFTLSCSTANQGADDLIGTVDNSENEKTHRIYAYFDAPFIPNIESPRKRVLCQAE